MILLGCAPSQQMGLRPFYTFDLFSIFGLGKSVQKEQENLIKQEPDDNMAVEERPVPNRRPPPPRVNKPQRMPPLVKNTSPFVLGMMKKPHLPQMHNNMIVPPKQMFNNMIAPPKQMEPLIVRPARPSPQTTTTSTTTTTTTKPVQRPPQQLEQTRNQQQTNIDPFVDFGIMPFEFMRKPVTQATERTTILPKTTTQTTTQINFDNSDINEVTTEKGDFEGNFFDFFPNSMSFLNPPLKNDGLDTTTVTPIENNFDETTLSFNEELAPLFFEPSTQRPTTQRPTEQPLLDIVALKDPTTPEPFVQEDVETTTPTFTFDEFSTMNPMKLLLIAMKKLKEMEDFQHSQFTGSINEVGNDIVDVIPKSLSASDNLIMLEPIKKGAVISVDSNPEQRDTQDGIKIVNFHKNHRYY